MTLFKTINFTENKSFEDEQLEPIELNGIEVFYSSDDESFDEYDLHKAEETLTSPLYLDAELARTMHTSVDYYYKDTIIAHMLSQKIHEKIKNYSFAELIKTSDSVYQLLFLWATFEADELNFFGLNCLFSLVEHGDEIAYKFAKKLAENSSTIAPRFAKTLLKLSWKDNGEEALAIKNSDESLQESTPNSKNANQFFNNESSANDWLANSSSDDSKNSYSSGQ